AAEFVAAQQLEMQGKLTEARAAYAVVIALAPNDVPALHRLAVVCTTTEDHAAAADYYNRALVLAPHNVDLLTDAGYACYVRGEYEAAELLLRDAVAQSPKHERAVNNLALVLGLTGRMEEALAVFWLVSKPVDAWRNMSYVYQQRSEWAAAVACYEEARKLDDKVTVPPSLLARRNAPKLPPPETQLVVAESAPIERLPVVTADQTAEIEAEVVAVPADPFVEPLANEAEAVVVEEPPAFVEPEPELEPADLPVLNELDFGPFEPPVIVEPSSTEGGSSARRSSPRLPPGAMPIITPGWPSIPREDSFVDDPTIAVVIAERPLKRGLPDVPFDVVYDADEDLAAEPITTETIELAGDEWAEEVAAIVVDSLVDDDRRPLLDEQSGGRPSAALALTDCCLIALHDERRVVASRPEFAVAYHDQRFCFSSADAAQRFADDPENYLPASGGMDMVAVRRGWIVVAGSLDHAVWFRGKLFLFSTADNLVAFQTHPYRYVDYE
ncbi:MAG: tetratricopeptide repeat protein, partial [Planctomycetaceae bacterium]|nr:tetratricopeptide repeat protein [Planctomycetaceae bacterium]